LYPRVGLRTSVCPPSVLNSRFTHVPPQDGDRILDLIPEESVTDLRTLGLNERQIEALRLMVNEGKELSNADYRQLFNVSQRTATRDLTGLVQTGWVHKVGVKRGTRYTAQ
jgi:predicted HTH transcriptional regulator